jgi:hypothetical protein
MLCHFPRVRWVCYLETNEPVEFLYIQDSECVCLALSFLGALKRLGILRGRPPFFPFCRAAIVFARLLLLPPSVANVLA